MNHPLAGVVEKLRNADTHLNRLQDATLVYLNSGTHAAIVSERDASDSTRGRMRFKVLRQPPLELAAIAGDVVHNLRSSLDYVVEELVKRNGNTPTIHHQFPIAENPTAFSRAVRRGRVSGVSDRAVRAIEGFQPYHVKADARPRHPLNHLQTLSNRDKHHMLAISALNAQFVWSFVGAGGRVLRSEQTTEPVHDGGVLAEVPVDFVIDGEKAQLQSKLSVRIGFDEPAFTGFDVAAVLQNIRELIGQYMLPAFALFFEPLPDDLRLMTHGLTSRAKPVELLIMARANPSQRSDSTSTRN